MRPDWRELPRGDIRPEWAGVYVTMNPAGLIRLSKATFQRMGEPKAFVILFDTVNNKIGLKPAALTTRNAYPVRLAGQHGSKVVRANRLIKEYRIALPMTVRFYDADTDEDGILVLDLRTAKVSPGSANHSSRKQVAVGGRQ